MDKRRTYGNWFKHLFAVVVCDKGNKVKNPNSQVHLVVAKLFAPTVWIQSATPALNAPVDLTGHLALWWRDEYSEDINNFELPEDERMYTDATWAKVQKKCPAYAAKHQEPLYILNPVSYARLCNAGKMTGEVANTVLRYLLNHM
jgi:hypothetical protein